MATVIDQWHELMASGDAATVEKGLDKLLADDATFHSPVVHTPQEGKAITKMYLMGALHVLGSQQFRYLREVVGDNLAVLEFQAEAEGIQINGVDMIEWNDEGKIVDFKVMVRPLKAINTLHRLMGEMLEKLK